MGGTPRVSPDKVVPSPEDGRPAPQQERVKSPSPEPRAARGRSELARAKIRATLREDSLSDEELVGARVPYRRRLKDDDGSKSKAEVETRLSSKINRKAWQALGEEMQNPDESFNGSESLTKDVSDNHSEAKTGEDGYETVVIKPKEKKRDKRSKGARESSPATIDQLLGDDEEKPRRRTQATRHERLMEDLFDENEVPPKNVGKAKKVRCKKESTDSEEPLSQRLSGKGRSERSEGSIDEASSLPHSPERRKPMTEAESGYFEKEPVKLKRRGRPSKKDKKEEIPEDVMEAMREMNGLRGRKSNKPMDSPRSATHQAQGDPAVQSTDSIEADEMEASNGDEVQPETSTESTGPDLLQHNSSEKEEQTEDDFPENAPSKGHSLIVKSRDSKNKVSLVIKPLESSTEEPLESNTE